MILIRRAIALVILLAVMFQINCIGIYCVLFKLNQDAIAETQCERKVMNCCGECYLEKQMNQTTDDTAKTPASSESSANKNLEKLLSEYIGFLPNEWNKPLRSSPVIFFSSNTFAALGGEHTSVFHPPPSSLFI